MGYIKSIESKVIRTRHKIEFFEGTRNHELLSYLKHVPDRASIIDSYYDDERKIYVIEFMEESEDPNGQT